MRVETDEFDLVVRGGQIHDGTGAAPTVGDIGIKDGRIVAVGPGLASGREEIDASGSIVTPGFVDIHTHYDGQAIWDDELSPSSWHGVTTAVMGNCGVGFAPCKVEDRDALIELMEGVEDIPAPVMHAGLDWQWETFAEYLEALEKTPRDIDLCALIPHAPVRVYVMGKRALRLEPATADDVAAMRQIVADGIEAGAFGVSTSRTTAHKDSKGGLTPTVLARERELTGLMEGMKDAGGGLCEFVTESTAVDPDVLGEFEIIRRGLRRTGQPAVYSLTQSGTDHEGWRRVMDFSDSAMEQGTYLRPVVAPRAIGLILGLEASKNPFIGTATYNSIAHLPFDERVQRMKDPEVRLQMLRDDPLEHDTWPFLKHLSYERMFPMGSPINYVPDADQSLAKLAESQGRTPQEYAYDLMLENDGMGLIYCPLANYGGGDLSACEAMLANPNAIMGLGDGGAHVGFILDASFTTWLLKYWVRERGVMSVAEGVRRLTSDTADVVGLRDRGRIAIGMRADLNVIDLDSLEVGDPKVVYDLPDGGKRMAQRAEGYVATVVHGVVTRRLGEDTGARPGRLVRSGDGLGRQTSSTLLEAGARS